MTNPFLKFAKPSQAASSNPFLKFAKTPVQPLKRVEPTQAVKSNPWNTPLKNNWTKTQPMSKAGTTTKNPLLRLDIPSGIDNAGSTQAVETKGNVFGAVGSAAKKVYDWQIEQNKKSEAKRLADQIKTLKENKESYRKLTGVDISKLSEEQIKEEAKKVLAKKDKLMNLAMGATEPLKAVGGVGKALKGVKAIGKVDDVLAQEARKYKTAEEFVDSANTVNPSEKGVFQKYIPELRNKMPIGENIQTLDKSIGGKPDDLITIYRGTSGNKINAGDYITTNKQLAKDYAGTGNVVELKVRKGDIIDTIDDAGMEEYIYKPNSDKLKSQTKSQLTDIFNQVHNKGSNSKTAGAGGVKISAKDNRIKQGVSTQLSGKEKALPQDLKLTQNKLRVLLKSDQPSGKEMSVNSLKQDITNIKNSQINASKLNISEEGKNLIKKTVEEVKPAIQKYTGKVLTNKEAFNLARKSSAIIEKAAGRDATLQWEAAMLNARKKMAYAAEKGRVDQDFIDGLVAVKTQGTDIARKLQSFAIKANPEDNTSMQAIIEAVLDTGAKTDDVLKAAKGVDFTDLKQATEFYRKFVAPTATEWIDLLRYNSMLSSPLTHIINIFSNLVNTATVKPVEKALAGGIDFLGSKITGKERKMFAGESGEYLKGYFSSVKEATKRLSGVMQGKRVYTNLDVKQIPVAVSGKKGAVATTLSYPMRLLEGMDQFFTALSEGGETAALKLRATKGAKVGNIATQAQKKAAYTIYRQGLFDENQGIVLDMIDQFTRVVQSLRNNKNPLVSNIAKFTVPFIQTPMNIFKQGIEYSPIGFSTMIGAGNKTEQLTKAIMGSAVFASAATMLASNRLSWGEPIDAKTKAEYRAAGKQPYSVKIGNNWVSYQKLPPTIAFPIAMVASLDDLLKSKRMDDTTADLVLGGIAKFGSFFADQSYVKSLGDLLAAAKGDEYAITKTISNYPQQLIPFRALTGWLARLSDDTQRLADNKAGFVDQQIQWLMTNYPGLSQKVPARKDAQGNPVKQQNRFVNAFSPVRMTSEDIKKAKDFEEILKLKKLNQNETIKSSDLTKQAEESYAKLKTLPDKAQKKQFLLNLAKENEPLVRKIIEMAKDDKLNLTYQDKMIKQLGVANGERGKYIKEKLKEFKTREEKKAWLLELARKGIVTKEVLKTIKDPTRKD